MLGWSRAYGAPFDLPCEQIRPLEKSIPSYNHLQESCEAVRGKSLTDDPRLYPWLYCVTPEFARFCHDPIFPPYLPGEHKLF